VAIITGMTICLADLTADFAYVHMGTTTSTKGL
jgi:hypothetical protein